MSASKQSCDLREWGSSQSGLSLIELMISLALGLIIVAAMAELFVNISRTNQEMAKTNSQIENARFSMQLLQNDIVHAGYWAGFVPDFDNISLRDDPTDFPTAVPDPCLAYTTPWSDAHRANLLGIPLQVHTDTATQPGTCSAIVTDRITHAVSPAVGNDVLVVRHAHTCEAGVGNCDDAGTTAGQLYFQASNCNSDTDTYALDPNSPPLLTRTCTAGVFAPRRKFIQSIYYIREWANESSDGIPTLVRSEFGVTGTTPTQQAAVPLVEGIERLRIELGIDNYSEPYATSPFLPYGNLVTSASYGQAIDWDDPDNWTVARNRGDGIPDPQPPPNGPVFIHCPTTGCTVDQLANIAAVKVYILARANEPTPGYTDTKSYTLGSAAAIGPFNDNFKRHVFSMTMRLNNVSARRETP
jgi:type IV pilus assembly protein PilW